MEKIAWNEHIEIMTSIRIVKDARNEIPTRRPIESLPKRSKESWVSIFTD